jgi:dTDP-N-acetylfucosamine:lipid II N-acetylfucosaminyltransferase
MRDGGLFRHGLFPNEGESRIKKLKAVHVHTDLKFLDAASKFEGDLFHNTTVVLAGKEKYEGASNEMAIFLGGDFKAAKRAMALCQDADLVVAYGLTVKHAFIANRLPQKVKIAWRFFGGELYDAKKELFLSPLTMELLADSKPFFSPYRKFKNILSVILSFAQFGWEGRRRELDKAIKRMDFFICLSGEEYDFLKAIQFDLPPLIRWPRLEWAGGSAEKPVQKEPIVVIGNSRAVWNNHLDLIEIISRSNNRSKYQFLLLFSYGPENRYTRCVRAKTEGRSEFRLLEEVMPKERFLEFYSPVSALVINSYRQSAVGNIFKAMRSGVKIYLNEKNIVLKWLRDEGFLISTMEDFINDLDRDNLTLGDSEMLHNQTRLKAISEKYSIEIFQRQIYEKIMTGADARTDGEREALRASVRGE